MKKTTLLLFSFLLCITSFAQNLNYAKEVVKKLASEDMYGRGYVKDGNQKAAEFIIGEFKKFELLSFEKNYKQSFDIQVNTFPSSMSLKLDNEQLIPGKDFIVDNYSASLKGKFEVIQINKTDLLDKNNLSKLITNCKDKVVLIDETNDTIKSKELSKKTNEIINILKYSPEVKSSATIIYTDQKLTWSVAQDQAVRPVLIVNKDINISEVKHVNINVKAELSSHTTQNLCGYYKGTVNPDSFLVITAHYDHLGMMGNHTYFPGANDNASGVAMLLNIAQYFHTHPPKYSILFIALSAEEIGLIGAKYFVENPLIDLSKIKFLVNFDLAGTGDEGIKVVNGKVYQPEFNQLKNINLKYNYLPSVQIRGEACNSDHCMFYQKGVPCFYIYTLGGIKAYHDIYDRYDTLPFTEFEDYSKLMIDFFSNF